MHEVEAKLRIGAPDDLRRRMADLGAPLGPPRVQEDVFFQHPDRDLAATDEALRLRTEEGFQELTYKGPRAETANRTGATPRAADAVAGGLKSRVEWNIPVGADPTALLEALGFRPAARLVKQRARARLEACEVVLDHIEGLGWFVEVEGLHEDPARAGAAVRKTLVRLGLQDAPLIQESYLELALGGLSDHA